MRARIAFRLSLALGAALPLLVGCSVTPPPTPTARDFGVAHRLAVFGQTANPAAEENLEPVEGIDGKVSLATVNNYRTGRGYNKEMDSSTFDIRPTQPSVSEVTYKDGGKAPPTAVTQPIGK